MKEKIVHTEQILAFDEERDKLEKLKKLGCEVKIKAEMSGVIIANIGMTKKVHVQYKKLC